MRSWKTIGVVATIVIILSFPAYLLREFISHNMKALPDVDKATFVGSKKCAECHRSDYELWLSSDHAHSMAYANDSTVRGDFNNITFVSDGFRNRFYKKDGKFYVYTRGPEGKAGNFRVPYTFGYHPLQQYLVPFGKGRLQCLPFAWDTQRKRWFNLHDTMYQGQIIKPNDWLYWTNNGQNWNGMCADCHSTNLKKNYNPVQHTFHTTWSEINVGCEACHGPGSKHLEWAALPEMSRLDNDNMGLLVKTRGITSDDYVKQCARCHSRREVFSDFHDPWNEMLDYMDPQLLLGPYYFPDGQIHSEDYVYGSFTQSLMYRNGVKCSDCHDVHSGKVKYQDNRLCLQCHRAAEYDTYKHYFHKKIGEPGKPLEFGNGKTVKVGAGSLCINCHMPGRYYMGVDFRRDHSIRIPRPDLTVSLGVPNACNQCHTNKSAQWAEKYINKWYGISRRPHYGTVMAEGRKGDTSAIQPLIKIAQASDVLYAPIVRATAVALLCNYQGDDSRKAVEKAMDDADPMVRLAAVKNYRINDGKSFLRNMQTLLHDPVMAVRMNAALKLTMVPAKMRDTSYNQAFQKALGEYKNAMEYMADFPSSMFNLGMMYGSIGQIDKAQAAYQEALRIDHRFYPAEVNLAMIYNREQRNDKAEALFRDVMKKDSSMHGVVYSLGLLLVEEKKYDQALQYLKKAGALMPERSRIFYNLGLLYQMLGNTAEAEKALKKALHLEPDNPDYLYALVNHYIRTGHPDMAKPLAIKLEQKYPSSPIGQNLLDVISNMEHQGRDNK